MRRAIWLLTAAALLAACAAVKGEVEHPRPGQKNTVAYCAKNDPEENTCMHCGSKPGCGFCSAPAPGSAACQPGIAGDVTPTTCGTALVVNTTECEAPPPPLEQEP